MGHPVAGIGELLELLDVPVHVQAAEAPWVTMVCGVGEDALMTHESGDQVMVGDVSITLLHTPGHTPGSQCLLVDGRLVSGDTLFLEGCGRTDLPGSDPEEMYRTLSERLAPLSGETVLFPGHFYSADASASLEHVRATNYVLAPTTAQQWRAMFA